MAMKVLQLVSSHGGRVVLRGVVKVGSNGIHFVGFDCPENQPPVDCWTRQLRIQKHERTTKYSYYYYFINYLLGEAPTQSVRKRRGRTFWFVVCCCL